MPELSHDAAEDGFHEIQLSGKQIVFLFMVLTVASAVIFLCGVLVGRGVRSARGETVDNPAAAAAANPTAPQTVAENAPSSEPPPPSAETPTELSYHKRLQGEGAPKETVKPESARPEPAKPEPARQEAAKLEAARPEAKPESRSSAEAPPSATAGATSSPAAGARSGAWIVQVGAFSNTAAARDVVRRLSSKGYPAFLVNPSPGMPAIYRVQVGGYSSRSEADEVARRIEKDDRFKPVVRQNR